MTEYAARLIESDYDSQVQQFREIGGALPRGSYLQQVGVTHQTLWNWRTGRAYISRRKALEIERRTGGRLRAVDLLARGDDDRRTDGYRDVGGAAE